MCDSMHETAATPSVSLAAVEFVSLAAAAMCGCVFSKTMYLDSQRYTVFWPYTICRPNTKTKISRKTTHTHTHPHRRSVFFFLHVAIRNSLRSNNTTNLTKVLPCRVDRGWLRMNTHSTPLMPPKNITLTAHEPSTRVSTAEQRAIGYIECRLRLKPEELLHTASLSP